MKPEEIREYYEGLTKKKEDKFWRIYLYGLKQDFQMQDLYSTPSRKEGLIEEWNTRQSRRHAKEIIAEMRDMGFIEISDTKNDTPVYASKLTGFTNLYDAYINAMPPMLRVMYKHWQPYFDKAKKIKKSDVRNKKLKKKISQVLTKKNINMVDVASVFMNDKKLAMKIDKLERKRRR